MKIKWGSVSCVLCVCESIIKALNQRDNVRCSTFLQEPTVLPASGSIAAKDKRLSGPFVKTFRKNSTYILKVWLLCTSSANRTRLKQASISYFPSFVVRILLKYSV